MTAVEMIIGNGPLSVASLKPSYRRPIKATIDEAGWQRIRDSRERLEHALQSGQVHYGVNTGFGNLKNVHIQANDIEQLQENLVRSHAVGTGAHASEEVVRWMLLFKMHALLLGYSGIRPDTLSLMNALLDADCLPVVPSKGSLGASGDLAPLAHLVMPLIGEGHVLHAGQIQSTEQAFKALGFSPIKLSAKEGLALINGTQYMSATATVALVRAQQLSQQADIIGAMTLEACQGSLTPFDQRLHEIRRHPGAMTVAKNFRQLLQNSEIMQSHANCGKVQDPYSLRCIAQVHGATRDAIAHAEQVVNIEINSVTDNPVLFDNGDVLSGGNFHGQSLALVLDYLAMAVSELSNISQCRTYLLLAGQDGLPPMLVEDPGLNSGLMILQYSAAALVNENKVLCHPASVDTIPTSMGQEDHVSMGGTSANKLLTILDNTQTVLAIEMLCAAQGLDFRSPLKAGLGAELAHQTVSKDIPHAHRDRAFVEDLHKAQALLDDRQLIDAVEQGVGALA